MANCKCAKWFQCVERMTDESSVKRVRAVQVGGKREKEKGHDADGVTK